MGLVKAYLIFFPAIPLEEVTISYEMKVYTKKGNI